MFDDDDGYSDFRAKPRDARRRTTIASQVSHADLGIETSGGPLRLYITTSVVVEIDDDSDLPLNIHPAAIRASAGFTPLGAGGATCDRRSWSGLRSRSHVAGRLAA